MKDLKKIDWIKVSDRLPTTEETEQPLWVINGIMVWIAVWTTEGVWISIGAHPSVLTSVTHWAIITDEEATDET